MRTRVLLIALAALLTTSCGGGDKHLPSSNPPEYEPKKVYSAPSPAPSRPPAQLAKPTELELLQRKLQSLESGPDPKGRVEEGTVQFRLAAATQGSHQSLRGLVETSDGSWEHAALWGEAGHRCSIPMSWQKRR